METIFSTAELRPVVAQWRRRGERIAFVPTMGNLHDGHLSLLQRAKDLSDRTIVSIFVNPIQFGQGEDYAKYPSTLQSDQEKLASCGLDVLFSPNLRDLYPGGTEEDTRVTVPGLSTILCGEFRPGHFSGVATVVTKLFFSVQPDCALFGEKDLQQLKVIRRMVNDLCIPIEIIGQPIIREPDGLAMSSRNGYLSSAERVIAPKIHQTLRAARTAVRDAKQPFRSIESNAIDELRKAGFKPEYFSIRQSANLDEATELDDDVSILVAAWLGKARLIDNIQVNAHGD
ncbi:MAG: pantoate--beta-alanine ligase [Gammaproteobacteria bacterium]|jgi:pantoate--beta-alanine ligase